MIIKKVYKWKMMIKNHWINTSMKIVNPNLFKSLNKIKIGKKIKKIKNKFINKNLKKIYQRKKLIRNKSKKRKRMAKQRLRILVL